jgi:hypothetical protein
VSGEVWREAHTREGYEVQAQLPKIAENSISENTVRLHENLPIQLTREPETGAHAAHDLRDDL